MKVAPPNISHLHINPGGGHVQIKRIYALALLPLRADVNVRIDTSVRYLTFSEAVREKTGELVSIAYSNKRR